MMATTLEALAAEAVAQADDYRPLGAGLCLPVAAALSHVLAARGVSDVTAVAGAYIGDAHWWVRVGPFIVDPTRGQFDSGSLVTDTRVEEHWQYVPETTFPPGWSEEHVILEAERTFYFADIGRRFGSEMLARLFAVIDGQEA